MAPMEKEHEKIEFELEDEESDSIEDVESEEEEPHTPILRISSWERRQLERYLAPDFQSSFGVSITDDNPINVKEVIGLEDNRIWKKLMVG